MAKIYFVLVGEGVTEVALVPPLQTLCILCGAEEAFGIAPDLGQLRPAVGTTVADKIGAALRLEPNADLIFVHRDADSRNPAPRHREIRAAMADHARAECVPLVPVQATEAWLLLNEKAIRQVAGNPRGKVKLNLPSPRQVEEIAKPWIRLQKALLAASELGGRRRDLFKRRLSQCVKQLVAGLDPQGAVSQTASWQRLCSDLTATIQSIKV